MRATKSTYVSSLLRRVTPPRGFPWVFVAVLWALISIYQVDWKAPGAMPGVTPGGLRTYAARTTTRAATTRVKIKLHGSTPTMAWSPNGKKLAFNAAFEHFDFDDEYRKHKSALGVFVYNVARGKKRRVTAEQGYHPLWLSTTRLAWGNSGYEYGSPGMYLARLKRRFKPKILRLSTYRRVYHTLVGKKAASCFSIKNGAGEHFNALGHVMIPKTAPITNSASKTTPGIPQAPMSKTSAGKKPETQSRKRRRCRKQARKNHLDRGRPQTKNPPAGVSFLQLRRTNLLCRQPLRPGPALSFPQRALFGLFQRQGQKRHLSSPHRQSEALGSTLRVEKRFVVAVNDGIK
jgi:hypothetical protein